MLKIKSNRKAAFTLAETLITVVILGIVAAILVPSLIKNQVENANRTKVKKAMAAYEKAINFIILENDIKSTEELKEFGEEETCKFSKAYFKTVQDGTNDCIFKTADRVWWDITDLTNPILILKDSQLNKSTKELQTLAKNVTDKTVFSMVGRFDDVSTLRINDNAYEQTYGTTDQRKYVGKLWYFITQSTSVLIGIQKCEAEGATTCTLKINGVDVTYNKISTKNDTIINKRADNSEICLYDRENNTQDCNSHTLVAPAGDYWLTSDLGAVTEEEADNSSGSVCSQRSGYCRDYDYFEGAKKKCEKLGGRVPSIPELSVAYQNGLFISSGELYYWADEEWNAWQGYVLNKNGLVRTSYKHLYPATKHVICITD